MADAPSRSQKVTVCCRLPHGLVLELNGDKMEAPTPGAREVKVFFPIGEKVTIVGSTAAHPDSANPGKAMLGFGMTEVDAEFWNKWVSQNQGFPPLVNGTLFAQPTPASATSEASNRANMKTGLEPLNPDKPAPGITRDDGKSGA